MAGLSINEMTTFRWSFDEDIARYRDAGIEAVGVWRQKLADFGEDKGIELVHRSGLKVSNLLWAGGFTGSDGHTYKESVEDAAEALQVAAALCAGHVVIYSGARNGHTQSHARRIFTSALGELLPLAEQVQVVLAIEPMHAGCAEEWTFVTTLNEATSLVTDFSSPWLKLVFDTYQLGHDAGIVEQIARLAGKIGIVHLGDGHFPPVREQNRRPLGEGALPLGCMVQALRQAGYDGFYDVELIGEDIESCDYGDLLARSRQAYEQLMLC